jgi:putative RNA 2'-phosphotransferase
MLYIMGHRPYEFGLVPDPEGYFTFKELLQSIHEEPDWSYVRQGNIHEVLMGNGRTLFQFDEKRIRAFMSYWHTDLDHPARLLPKILYLGIRRKAHPIVLEKGLRAIEGKHHVLSPDREMAERMGKRHDQKPVILEIMADAAQKKGVIFYPFGDLLLTSEIPAEYIAGPSLIKEYTKVKEKRSKENKGPSPDFNAGTFSLNLEKDMDRSRRAKGRKEKGWKEEAKRYRKRGDKAY